MRKRLLILTAVPLAAVVVFRSADDGAERVAYFKSENRNRVMVHTAPSPADGAAILSRAMWTEGRLTAAYLYPPDGAMRAKAALDAARPDVLSVTEAIETAAPGYTCRLTINPAGERAFSGGCGKR